MDFEIRDHPGRSAGGEPRTDEGDGSLPVGTVTFLMTDIEGSTRAWNTAPHDAKLALERHDGIVVEQIEKNQGRVVESGREGDSVLGVFRQASDAIVCALATQLSLQRETWPSGADMKVRIGLHTGEAELRSGHYVGAPLYRCARMLAIAHGGQVLISRATEELVADSLPDGVALRDLGQHALRDISRPEHIFQLLHADLAAEFPPLSSAHAERSSLPEQLTSFVGRQHELGALTNLIGQTRMLTLTGPGGVGKSRLAIELARATVSHWGDGVWWVDLTAIEDPQQVPNAVAAAMHLGGIGTAGDVVKAWLANKHGLLMLDSCEHLVEACADLCRACLASCRDLTILATSREGLGIAGEMRWPLSPLSEADALSLFEHRGRLVDPAFKITSSNRSDVSEICRRLDEVPLAIELAASRLGMMSERDISRQLADRLRLLSARRSDDPRHQTMTAAIDWSFRLLTESEATLFRRLSVFRGGFTLDSAQAICIDALVPDVLGALSALVEKSLVIVERHEGHETRYRLLELQAAFAEEKLHEASESEVVRKRHYGYFFDAMVSKTSDVIMAKDLSEETWRRREQGNLWAAVRWARTHEDDIGLRLAAEVANIPSGDLDQARAWLGGLLEASPEHGKARMFALRTAAYLAFKQGDSAEYLRLAQALRIMAEDWGDSACLVSALHGIGSAQLDMGMLDAAEIAYNEALRHLEGSPNSRQWWTIQNDLGCLALCRARYESALQILTPCVASMRSSATAPIDLLAGTMESLANAELGCGELERADDTWREALTMSAEIGDHWGAIGCLGGLARAATTRGDHIRAVRLAAAHGRLMKEFSCGEQPWWREQLRLSQELSRRELGASQANEAWREGLAMSYERALDYALGAAWSPAPT